MWQKSMLLLLGYLLLSSCYVDACSDESDDDCGIWNALPYMVVGGGLLAFGLPALGFTSAGIVANSVASTLMSWSAVINGGGVPAGGLVATLQSLGAGMGTTALAGVGATVGYEVHQNFVCQKEKVKELE
ncbi:interferon alpha-inducible protein 6 isoform X2 [Monodelphis domestica]|uniref:interferon alpha-inducible protein 6 isoform X2 n=1 Tax=Monodelphis domestica TaxID=13616 RepID=UPI0024E19DD9|nr:interferon alpha-inducible protein 6 isoform X2 [Monodelphis domestica]XP_056651421.1 interferon alpha-inducible protein 6 isoform X2 [Monodelphis domestica]